MAYEQMAGPFGDKWDREIAAQMHELAQFRNHLLGAAVSDEKHPNKVPLPELVPRPWDETEDTPVVVWATMDDEPEE